MSRRHGLYLLVLLSACGGVDGAVDATLRQAIIGGTPDHGDPAVIFYGRVNEGYCTGSLVGPRTVLTAAHCVGVFHAPLVYFGFDPAKPDKTVAVLQEVKHPEYPSLPKDVALVELAEAVTNVAPLPMNSESLVGVPVGTPIRHVGFGVGGNGVKNEATTAVSGIGEYSIYYKGQNKQTCNGDSGGPAFIVLGGQERIVGTVSYGDSGCITEGFDARVDLSFAFLSSTMASWEGKGCAADGVCMKGCTPADPDCVSFGQSCTSALLCASRACRADPQHAAYCTVQCGGAHGACPTDMSCNAGYCQFQLMPVRSVGEECAPEVFCENFGVCVAEPDAKATCHRRCDEGGGCPDTYACTGEKDGARYCLKAPESPPKKGCSVAETGPLALGGLAALGLLRRRRP